MSIELKVGDKIPMFSLPDKNGKTVEIKSFLGNQPIVIFFYPKDDSAGCTIEACAFRDSYEDFKEAGAEVIGISSDSADSHRHFADKHRLPFVLLSDEGGKVLNQFGVPRRMFGLIGGRVTYIVDKNGIIVKTFDSMILMEQHSKEAIEAIRKL